MICCSGFEEQNVKVKAESLWSEIKTHVELTTTLPGIGTHS